MEPKTSYRLKEYRITEYEAGLLWWETHFDFGRQRSGECFINGNILIIKPWSDEKDGLLIGEFLDQLTKLPSWDKTLYYCFFSELLEVKTGRKLTADLLKQMSSRMNPQQVEAEGLKELRPGSYRIDRYRITINDDRTISWQTPGGMNQINGGQGLIESDILFLGPMVGGELKQNKQDFLDQLSRLPQWTITIAWCRHSALRFCMEKQKVKSPGEIPTQPKRLIDPVSLEHPSISTQSPKKEPSPKQPISDFPFLRSLPSFFSWFIPWFNKFAGFAKSRHSRVGGNPDLRNQLKTLDSRFHGNDGNGLSATFYESINSEWTKFSWSWFSGKKIWITSLILFVLSGLIVAGIVTFHALEEKFNRPQWYKKNHHERRGEHHSKSGFTINTFLIFLTLLFILPFNRLGWAEEKDIILEESGIHYPRGFDLNTVGEVQGKATHFSRPEKGPLRFQLTVDRESYTVLTSPSWYWKDNQFKLPEGTEIFVRGSKSFGKDGRLYIVAQEIRIPSSGQNLLFRGKDGRPLWKDHQWSGRETPGGLGSSSDGRGGFGAGGGSRGHGRR